MALIPSGLPACGLPLLPDCRTLRVFNNSYDHLLAFIRIGSPETRQPVAQLECRGAQRNHAAEAEDQPAVDIASADLHAKATSKIDYRDVTRN